MTPRPHAPMLSILLVIAAITGASLVALGQATQPAGEAGEPGGPGEQVPRASAEEVGGEGVEEEVDASVMESDRVLRDLLRERDPAEDRGIEPRRSDEPGVEGERELDTVDPALLGTAPGVGEGGEEPVRLRREGEFVLSRDGRLRRLEGSGDDPLRPGVLFVFDADSATAGEPPMILQPCRLLESMEAIAARRGPDTVFTVTGQVYAYGGANYLLPTMMKVRVERENLD